MADPVRLQLSRRKGFDLQAASLATNGLSAQVVTRGTMWGNPFSTLPSTCLSSGGRRYATTVVATAEEAVRRFKHGIEAGEKRRSRLNQLRGKNLACWCKPGAPCHADILLELANRPICEEA